MSFPMRGWVRIAWLCLATMAAPAAAQRSLTGTAEIKLALEKLNVLGSVLMIAAHPDDENTALLAWCARGRKLRTAYLSLTRGEGGQNLIGSEQGERLGLIRTEELLAARRIDGAAQLFTRAIDFGFSKSAEETLAKWGRERILADVVRTIRGFRPDAIILRFSGTPRDGHGHHQSSAILAREAFDAAADPARFPEQLRDLRPWKTRRLLYNVFAFRPEQEKEAAAQPGRIEIDTGQFDPVLGYSYSEIAGMSRSMHQSQGMGSAERRGPAKNYLLVTAGEPATRDPLEGVDTTWNRVAGGAGIGRILGEAARGFDLDHPEKPVPALRNARALLAGLAAAGPAAGNDPWIEIKRSELDEAIALCAGLWLDAEADTASPIPGRTFQVHLTAINRGNLPAALMGGRVAGVPGTPALDRLPVPLAHNRPMRDSLSVKTPEEQPYSQPYWLKKPPESAVYALGPGESAEAAENAPLMTAHFRVQVDGEEIEIARPVLHRWVDRVRGELTRMPAVTPPVAVEPGRTAMIFPDASPRRLEVQVRAQAARATGELRLEAPPEWKVSPASQAFAIAEAGEQAALSFLVTPPAASGRARLRAVATIGGREVANGVTVIDYPHIPPQTLLPPAVVELVRADVRGLARRVGYVMGAGDEVPQALEQLGCQVTLLGAEDLARGDLSRFDAIVTGVRAYNVRKDLRASQQRLLEWVHGGGTLLVQYNVLEGGFFGGDPKLLARIGPYPLRIGRERVSVEDAPVRLLNPAHALLESPNRITAADFDGWVQERGLYFATEWDPRYEALWESGDPGEKPLAGGTLYARLGKGAYIFTAYSWFRQLPAGVPGAFRLFANLLSAGGTAR